jgi:hypothetical protein
MNPEIMEPIGAPKVNTNSYTVSLGTIPCPIITAIRVETNPLYGPSAMPESGLIMKIHPNHTPAEKPGVTTMSSTTPMAAKRAIRESVLVFILQLSPRDKEVYNKNGVS